MNLRENGELFSRLYIQGVRSKEVILIWLLLQPIKVQQWWNVLQVSGMLGVNTWEVTPLGKLSIAKGFRTSVVAEPKKRLVDIGLWDMGLFRGSMKLVPGAERSTVSSSDWTIFWKLDGIYSQWVVFCDPSGIGQRVSKKMGAFTEVWVVSIPVCFSMPDGPFSYMNHWTTGGAEAACHL